MTECYDRSAIYWYVKHDKTRKYYTVHPEQHFDVKYCKDAVLYMMQKNFTVCGGSPVSALSQNRAKCKNSTKVYTPDVDAINTL